MGKDTVNDKDLSTTVYISDTEDIADVIGRMKGRSKTENVPKPVQVVPAPSNVSSIPQARIKNYMENDAWFCSLTGNEEVENKFVRAKTHLEYKEWYDAERKFTEILELEPDNSGAHMGIFLAKSHMTEVKKLGEAGPEIDIQKEKELLNAYINGNDNQRLFIEKALESRIQQNRYTEGLNKMKTLRVSALEEAEKIFIELGDYLDSKDMAKKCREEIRKKKVIDEAGKLLAKARDSDATNTTIIESLNKMKKLHLDNQDIIGTDLDDSIQELENKANQISKSDIKRINNNLNAKATQSTNKGISLDKWLTRVSVVLFIVLILFGMPSFNMPYVVNNFFAYLPAPITGGPIWITADDDSSDRYIPYIFSLQPGEVEIVCNGYYSVQNVILPFANSVSLVIQEGVYKESGDSLFSSDEWYGYDSGILNGAVFPDKMTKLTLHDFSGGIIEVPEGTKELYIEDSSIDELILPESLEVLHIVTSKVTKVMDVPEGCTDIYTHGSTIGR